ncbi:MAG: hypothetical protein HC805_06015 [Alkalinema sp. RL_2_19]|nr:hypothetical protein [Alkalinema sp. RL_2_19]
MTGEQARQRLRDRGELPPANVTVPTETLTPAIAPGQPPPVPGQFIPGQFIPGQFIPGQGIAPSMFPAPPVVQPFDAYRLGPRDAIGIVVQRFADFNVQAVVDPEGDITHPIIGKVNLQGSDDFSGPRESTTAGRSVHYQSGGAGFLNQPAADSSHNWPGKSLNQDSIPSRKRPNLPPPCSLEVEPGKMPIYGKSPCAAQCPTAACAKKNLIFLLP